MAAPKYASEQYVKYFFSAEAVTARPTQWEVALHTGLPAAGNEKELSSFSYARQPVSFSIEEKTAHFEATNTTAITFPTGMASDSGTITHYTVRDKAANKMLAVAAFPLPITYENGVQVIIPAEQIKIRGI